MSDDFKEFVGEFKEFKRVIIEDMKEIKSDIKLLNNFKWRLAGGGAILCMLITIFGEILTRFFIK